MNLHLKHRWTGRDKPDDDPLSLGNLLCLQVIGEVRWGFTTEADVMGEQGTREFGYGFGRRSVLEMETGDRRRWGAAAAAGFGVER